MRNILKENMLRFNTKNLKNSTTRNMILESVQPSIEDMVTLNGKQHAVIASAWDESSIDPNDTFTASKISEAGANANNWVLLQTSNGSYDVAYDDLAGDQLSEEWNDGAWMFASADDLQPATNAAGVTADAAKIKHGDAVIFDKDKYYVHASYRDFDYREIKNFQFYKSGAEKFNPEAYLVLRADKPDYDSWLAADQVEDRSNEYVVVNASEVTRDGTTNTAAASNVRLTGSWEEFMAAIANKINTDNINSNLTSAEIDGLYENMPKAKQIKLYRDVWGEYKWCVGTNNPVGAENAVSSAIKRFFPKTK